MTKATIHYYVKVTHPDIEYIDNINQLKEYSDTFRVEDLSDHTVEKIKRELALVAGGGYNTQGILIMYYTIGGEKQ